jgi:oxalate decarboxylase
VSLLQADGKMFIDDVGAGDLCTSRRPAALDPGTRDDGCEFLLVFDQGDFSEDDTFLVSEFLAYTSPEMVKKNIRLVSRVDRQAPKERTVHLRCDAPGIAG